MDLFKFQLIGWRAVFAWFVYGKAYSSLVYIYKNIWLAYVKISYCYGLSGVCMHQFKHMKPGCMLPVLLYHNQVYMVVSGHGLR